ILREAKIPNYFDPARSVQSLEVLAEYRDISRREYDEVEEFDVDRERVRSILNEAEERGENRIGVEAMEILDAYGIPTPEGGIF
ncbi:MAG: CoA-binding protein, partial [Halobacteria archaeon]|nr:CoA-binding protein [Halobacteria archaeon]